MATLWKGYEDKIQFFLLLVQIISFCLQPLRFLKEIDSAIKVYLKKSPEVVYSHTN